MSHAVRILFSGLAEGTSQAEAANVLSAKFKLSEQKVNRFFQKQPVFAKTELAKAKKQQAMFASLGIQTRLVADEQTGASPRNESDRLRDEKIMQALDYITTSLIRLEEKVDELAQQNVADTDDLADDLASIKSEWDEELELEIEEPSKHRPNWLLFSLIGLLVLMVTLLLLTLLYPDFASQYLGLQ